MIKKEKNIVIILAAGKGTRMNSNFPKVIHKINGVPMINRVIKTAKKINPLKIIVVVGFKKDMVIKTINDDTINFVFQKEQKGTGHAIIQCIPEIKDFDGNILILSGDVPLIRDKTLVDFILLHNESFSDAALISTNLSNPFGYGRIIKNEKEELINIVEHKDASNEELKINEINSGIYLFKTKILIQGLSLLTNNNSQKEYYLTQVFEIINSNKIIVKNIKKSFEILGVNTIQELEKLELI